MSLVQYPDSDSDEDDKSNAIPDEPLKVSLKSAVKRKHSESTQDDLPPLPAAFHDLYTTNARVSTSDNPSLHGGRKRAIPHVEGNWPTHVYLEWIPLQAESNDLHNLIQHVRDTIADQAKTRSNKLVVPKIIPSLQSELGAPLPLHISLSRTLHIRTEDRDDFIETLKSCLRGAAVPTFPLRFHSLNWVPNFERNRWFLVLGIEKPAQNELNRLLNACNQATRRCGHSGLYIGGHGDGPMENKFVEGDPKAKEEQKPDRSDFFHISIAWNLEEPDADCISDARDIDVGKFVKPPLATFSVVKARIGNAVHSIDLKRGGTSAARSRSNNVGLI